MDVLKEQYWENLNPFKNGRFVFDNPAEKAPPPAEAEEKKPKEAPKEPEKVPSKEEAPEQVDKDVQEKEKEAGDLAKESIDKALKEKIELIDKTPDLQKKLLKKLNLSENLLKDPNIQSATKEMLKTFENKDLKNFDKVNLTEKHGEALVATLTKHIDSSFKEEKLPEDTKKNVDKISKALKEIGKKKEVADKMGLGKVFEKLTMFLQLFQALSTAMKNKDFKTFEEVVNNLTAQPPKNPAKEMENARKGYKETLRKIEKPGETSVDKLLTAYFDPRGDVANELFPGEGRYRMEAQTAIKDHLAGQLEIGIEEVKKGPGDMPTITAYIEGQKTEIRFYKKGDKLMTQIDKLSSVPDPKDASKTIEKTERFTKGDQEVKDIASLKEIIATGKVLTPEEREHLAEAEAGKQAAEKLLKERPPEESKEESTATGEVELGLDLSAEEKKEGEV